jgi:hypothetical protein
MIAEKKGVEMLILKAYCGEICNFGKWRRKSVNLKIFMGIFEIFPNF